MRTGKRRHESLVAKLQAGLLLFEYPDTGRQPVCPDQECHDEQEADGQNRRFLDRGNIFAVSSDRACSREIKYPGQQQCDGETRGEKRYDERVRPVRE